MKSMDDRKYAGTSRQPWKKTITAWLASKQSAKIFCSQQGLNESTFYYWRARLDPGYQPRNKMSPLKTKEVPQAFIPMILENRQPASTKAGIKFYYPNGCFIVLEAGSDLRLFQTVFEALRPSLCS
jgi:hypothetical protein